MPKLPPDVLAYLNSITAKRPRTVIQHIIEHGHVTSEELKDTYGYDHPPRAIRDVRELGIPIVTQRIVGTNGRRIADYQFGDMEDFSFQTAKTLGRTAFSKTLKKALIEKYGARCFIYLEEMDEAKLQIDHRIPYEITGEYHDGDEDVDGFMLLSPSANRTKSWVCEHCENWQRKEPAFCLRCFWAHPEDYDHVAGKPEKVIVLFFSGEEIKDYNQLVKLAGSKAAQKTIKDLIHKYLENL